MNRLNLLIVFLFVVTVFVGCGAQKRAVVVPQKSLPSWYVSPPLSNANELYAIGEGKNTQEAIANGLSMMASTLSVSISSDFRASTVVKEGHLNSVNATYESDLRSSVEELRISNYELLNSESLGFNRSAVLLKSDKNKLYESLLQETRQEFEVLAHKEKSIARANALQKIAFYQETQESLKRLPSRVIVMSVLQSSFDGSKYLTKMQYYDAKYTELRNSITFLVTTSQNASNLKPVIEKGLSEKRLRVGSRTQEKIDFYVHLKVSIQKAQAYGFTLARSEINFVTKDRNGNVVGTNRLNITGQSSQGFEVAKQSLAFELDQLVEKEGISRILGLGI